MHGTEVTVYPASLLRSSRSGDLEVFAVVWRLPITQVLLLQCEEQALVEHRLRRVDHLDLLRVARGLEVLRPRHPCEARAHVEGLVEGRRHVHGGLQCLAPVVTPTVALVDDCGADLSQCFLLVVHVGVHGVVCVVPPSRVHGQGRRLAHHVLEYGEELGAEQFLESPDHARVLTVQSQLPVLGAQLKDGTLRLPGCVIQGQEVEVEEQRRDCGAVVHAPTTPLVVHLLDGERARADVVPARQGLADVRVPFLGRGPDPHDPTVLIHRVSPCSGRGAGCSGERIG